MSELVRVERHGRTERIVLHRPQARNALSTSLLRELTAAVQRAAADRAVGALLISGSGEVFCAGADLVEVRGLVADPGAFREWLLLLRDTLLLLEQTDKPVIAAPQGLTVAGGLELLLACDLVIASDRARFSDGHARYGLVPGGGGSQRLPRAVGSRWARWLMYSGDVVDAHTAERIGLVQRVLAAESFDATVLQLVDRIAHGNPSAAAFMKRHTRDTGPSREGLDREIEEAVMVLMGPDAREGLAAFADKREPAFPSLGAGAGAAPQGTAEGVAGRG